MRQILHTDGHGSPARRERRAVTGQKHFDAEAAVAAAALAARRRKAGRTTDVRDIEIAGIAVSRKATLATRNVRHFDDLDVRVVNPWTA
jgi:predicted nucleic acid-binding protein